MVGETAHQPQLGRFDAGPPGEAGGLFERLDGVFLDQLSPLVLSFTNPPVLDWTLSVLSTETRSAIFDFETPFFLPSSARPLDVGAQRLSRPPAWRVPPMGEPPKAREDTAQGTP